jgi:hypothetical protein
MFLLYPCCSGRLDRQNLKSIRFSCYEAVPMTQRGTSLQAGCPLSEFLERFDHRRDRPTRLGCWSPRSAGAIPCGLPPWNGSFLAAKSNAGGNRAWGR